MKILEYVIVEIVCKFFPEFFLFPQTVEGSGVRIWLTPVPQTLINSDAAQEDQTGEQIRQCKESSDPGSGKGGHGSAEE